MNAKMKKEAEARESELRAAERRAFLRLKKAEKERPGAERRYQIALQDWHDAARELAAEGHR